MAFDRDTENTNLIVLIKQAQVNLTQEIIERIINRIHYYPNDVLLMDNNGMHPLILALDLQEPNIIQTLIDSHMINNNDRKEALKLAIEMFRVEATKPPEYIDMNTVQRLFTITEILKGRYTRQGGKKKSKRRKRNKSKSKRFRM